MNKELIFASIVLITIIPLSLAGDGLGYVDSNIAPQEEFDSGAIGNQRGWLEGWEFQLSPYGWASGVEGTVGVGRLSAPVDIGFDDVLEDMDAGVMLALDGRRDRFGFILEGFWLKVSGSAGTPGSAFSEVDVKVNEVLINGAVYYRAVEEPFTLDLMAGARYIYLDADIDFDPGLVAGRSADGSKDWIDPVLGFRSRFPITDRLSAVVMADIGGFGVSSDLTWQLYGGFNYQLSDSTELKLGWRHMEIDYDGGNFDYDVEMDGLTIGFGYSF